MLLDEFGGNAKDLIHFFSLSYNLMVEDVENNTLNDYYIKEFPLRIMKDKLISLNGDKTINEYARCGLDLFKLRAKIRLLCGPIPESEKEYRDIEEFELTEVLDDFKIEFMENSKFSVRILFSFSADRDGDPNALDVLQKCYGKEKGEGLFTMTMDILQRILYKDLIYDDELMTELSSNIVKSIVEDSFDNDGMLNTDYLYDIANEFVDSLYGIINLDTEKMEEVLMTYSEALGSFYYDLKMKETKPNLTVLDDKRTWLGYDLGNGVQKVILPNGFHYKQ